VLSIRTYSEQSEVSNLQTENRTTINRIKNEVLQGSEFLPTYDSRTVTINAANNSNTLIIKIPSIDNTESWIIDPITKEPKIDYFIYWTDSGDLYKKVVPDQLSTRNAEYGIISRNTEISCEYTIEGLESIKAGEESKISGADRVRITLKSSKTLRNKYHRS